MAGTAARRLAAAVLLVALATGCTESAPVAQAEPPARAGAAGCPESPPRTANEPDSTGGRSSLVERSGEAFSLTVCTYHPDVTGGRDSGGTAVVGWTLQPPIVQTGSELRGTLDRLAALEPVEDTADRPCDLALGPDHHLLVGYADGSTAGLTVVRNCDLVGNDHGAVRGGIMPVLADLLPG